MKRILVLILVLSMCLGVVSCANKNDEPDTDTVEDTTDTEIIEKKEPNKTVTLACSYGTNTYDIAELIGGKGHLVSKDGETLDGTTVKLDIGANIFDIVYTVGGIERTCEVRIARREGHRVVFNTNGGSFIETQYVADGATIDDSTVRPTRSRYTFAGWYDENGEKVTLSNTYILSDTTFIARWEGPNGYELPSQSPVVYDTSSAALNINWKDYANAFGYRPDEVLCTLKNTATNDTYTVMVGKKFAMFTDGAPAGASILQGAGNWTVKITGLTGDYTFTQNDLGTENYTTIQSGTTVINTIKKYEPLYDDSAALMTENGRFYDIAGNVVVLKGVVPWNVNHGDFAKNTSSAALKRLQEEGCNVIRITMPLGNTAGYGTPGKKEGYLSNMKAAVNRAAELGMYCIVDWGVMMKQGDEKPEAGYLDKWLEPAKEFFGIMSSENLDNPYIIFELANEPTVSVSSNDAWENYIKPWEEKVIRHIRGIDPDAMIIAAPNMHARRLSENNAEMGDDPIDKPFSTDISYNIAYTFHCYAYSTTYNGNYSVDRKNYGGSSPYAWRVCDAVKNGLAVVITEFSPANASMSSKNPLDSLGLDADFIEADKWMNFILENDVNYTMFRFGEVSSSAEAIQAQFMFSVGNGNAANNGTWTYDMLTACGKWYYDSALNTTGFIKAADFDASHKYNK